MKKTLIAAAAALCSAGAWSQVTLYGIADIGITRVSGYQGGSATQMASGIMEGSRWGIKGEEDLGGGYKALVTLESRIEVDTGTMSNKPYSGSQLPDRLTAGLPASLASAVSAAIAPSFGVNTNGAVFDRQSWVGLVTPVGGFLMGRQYTPAFEAVASYDIMATQSALSAGQLAIFPAGVDIRANDALQYRIVQGPWTASLMYGFPTSSSGDDELVGLGAFYRSASFSAGLGYNSRKNSAGQQALRTTVVGATVPWGSWRLSGLYGVIEEPNSGSAPELSAGLSAGGVPSTLITAVLDRLQQDARLMHLGARYEMGAAGHISVAFNHLDDLRSANADVSSYGVAYTYPLSKRTDLSAVLARFANSSSAQVAPGGNGYLGGVTSSAGVDSTSIALALRHSF